ncbi:MAG TPA: Sec-independent protein translocase protein TatB [Acetobacteraceae bacterium]
MFDFAWSEIALIAAVALIAIGPKDMPVAIRSITGMIKKARRMAAEFQTHVDEMVREANLDEVRNQINEIRNFDVRGEVEKAVDPDGSLRSTFASDPFATPGTTPGTTTTETTAPALDEVTVDAPYGPPAGDAPCSGHTASVPAAPAFIPPGMVPPPVSATAVEDAPPAFIPPDAVRQRRSSPPA